MEFRPLKNYVHLSVGPTVGKCVAVTATRLRSSKSKLQKPCEKPCDFFKDAKHWSNHYAEMRHQTLSIIGGVYLITIVQFSPTGNTAYLARRLGQLLQTTHIYALEHTDPTTMHNAEKLVILFPIHAFNAPTTVLRFVRALPQGRFNSISLISVGCNDSWANMAASLEVKKILTDKLYPIVVDETIAMPLTFIMGFPLDVVKSQLVTAHKTIELLASHITKGVVSQKHVPLKARVLSKIGKMEPWAARLFGLELHANKSCTRCGLCVKECPEGNIRLTERGALKFSLKCIMCLRCIYSCPVKAIAPRISKFIPIKNGYSIDNYVGKNAE